MTEICTVKKIKHGVAYVEIKRNERCDCCKACAFNGKDTVVMPSKSDVPITVGDVVVVEMPTKSVGLSSLLIYALPLLLMFVGALVGLTVGVWLQAVLAGVGIAVGLLLAWLIDRAYRNKDGYLPRILRVQDKDFFVRDINEKSDNCQNDVT